MDQYKTQLSKISDVTLTDYHPEKHMIANHIVDSMFTIMRLS